jgi:hypothetical protein
MRKPSHAETVGAAGHQVPPQQRRELFDHFGRAAIDKSGRPSPAHELAQRGPTRLAADRVRRARDLSAARRRQIRAYAQPFGAFTDAGHQDFELLDAAATMAFAARAAPIR